MDKPEEVKRYTPTFIKQEDGKKYWQGMADDANGNWVEYTALSAEREKVKELETNNLELGERTRKAEVVAIDLESQLTTANAKIVELEATQLSLDDICYRKLNSELEAELSTANKKAEKLVEALEKYGNHIPSCLERYAFIQNTKTGEMRIDCNCGFEQAINEFRGEM